MKLLVAVLFAGFGSVVAADTVAVFVIVPAVAVDVTTRVIVAEAALFMVPRVQMTGPVPVQVPWLGVAKQGHARRKGSTTPTPVDAAVGPALVTEIV